MIRRALDAETPEELGALDPPPPIFSSQGIGQEALDIAADGASAEFVSRLLPVVFEILRSKERPDWGGPSVRDAVWGHTLRWSGPPYRLVDRLYQSMEKALRNFFRDAPEEAMLHLAALRDSPWETAHFLFVRAVLGNPAAMAEEAATWLCEAPDALCLGDSDSAHGASRELIAAVTPHLRDATLDRLTDRLLDYVPAWEKTADARHIRGRAQLALLEGIDPQRRRPDVERRLGELQRKLRQESDLSSRPWRAFRARSPIPESNARKMRDDQWRRAMERHSSDDVAHELAQILEKLAAEEPLRFARLLVELPHGTHGAYVGGILRGIRDANLEPDLLLSVCRHGAATPGVGAWVVLIERRAESELPDELLTMVARYALPDSRDGTISAADAGAREAAILSLGPLVAPGSHRLAVFADIFGRLVDDPDLSVRERTVRSLIGVLIVDSAIASALFLQAIPPTALDAFLASSHVHAFLNWAVRTRFDELEPTIVRMLSSSSDEVVEAGARLLAIASFFRTDLDSRVDECLAGSTAQRLGAVGVFADSITAPLWRNRCIDVLVRAFDDEDRGIRSAASRCFWPLADEPLGPYVSLFERFAASRALQDDVSPVLHALERSTAQLPGTALAIGERFIQVHGLSTGDLRTAQAGDSQEVARIAIGIYAQSDQQDIRARALDLVDELLSFNAWGIDDAMDSLER